MNVLGIDPGIKGALALLSEDEKLLDIVDMPTLALTKSKRAIDLGAILTKLYYWRAKGEYRVIAERVSVRGGQKGVIETCRNGFVLEGIFVARYERYENVSPQKWQRSIFGANASKRGKGAARLKAQALWPEADLGNRKSQDRSDAALIALYGLRMRGDR